MVPSLIIGPRTLLNDCNHPANAIFWRSATLVVMIVGLSLAAARDACHNWLLSSIGPEIAHYCSAFFEHVPASLVPILSIVRRLASDAS